MDYRKKLIIVLILGVIFSLLGVTLAYWTWQSNNTQKTNILLTSTTEFTCSADGGGNISNTNYFVPTTCLNQTYA